VVQIHSVPQLSEPFEATSYGAKTQSSFWIARKSSGLQVSPDLDAGSLLPPADHVRVLEYTWRAFRALAAVSDGTVSRSAIAVQLNVARSLKAKMPQVQERQHLHPERPKHVLHESRAILRRSTGVMANYSAICYCRALSAHALAPEIGGPFVLSVAI